MNEIGFYKVNALPATLTGDSFYLVNAGGRSELFVTNASGVPLPVANAAAITSIVNPLIDSAIASASELKIADDIAARDSLTGGLSANAMILVVDASADPSVGSGSALYAHDVASSTTYKLAEYEGLSEQLSLAGFGLASSASQIDDAVNAVGTLDSRVSALEANPSSTSATWETLDW